MISARSAVDQDRMVETGTLGRIAPPSTRLRAWSNSSLGHKEPSCLGRCCGLTAEDSAGGPEAAPTCRNATSACYATKDCIRAENRSLACGIADLVAGERCWDEAMELSRQGQHDVRSGLVRFSTELRDPIFPNHAQRFGGNRAVYKANSAPWSWLGREGSNLRMAESKSV